MFDCPTCKGYGERPEDRGNFCLSLSKPCTCGGSGFHLPRWRAGLADPLDPIFFRHGVFISKTVTDRMAASEADYIEYLFIDEAPPLVSQEILDALLV